MDFRPSGVALFLLLGLTASHSWADLERAAGRYTCELETTEIVCRKKAPDPPPQGPQDPEAVQKARGDGFVYRFIPNGDGTVKLVRVETAAPIPPPPKDAHGNVIYPRKRGIEIIGSGHPLQYGYIDLSYRNGAAVTRVGALNRGDVRRWSGFADRFELALEYGYRPLSGTDQKRYGQAQLENWKAEFTAEHHGGGTENPSRLHLHVAQDETFGIQRDFNFEYGVGGSLTGDEANRMRPDVRLFLVAGNGVIDYTQDAAHYYLYAGTRLACRLPIVDGKLTFDMDLDWSRYLVKNGRQGSHHLVFEPRLTYKIGRHMDCSVGYRNEYRGTKGHGPEEQRHQEFVAGIRFIF